MMALYGTMTLTVQAATVPALTWNCHGPGVQENTWPEAAKEGKGEHDPTCEIRQRGKKARPDHQRQREHQEKSKSRVHLRQGTQRLPPQSMSVSSWFWMRSEQLGSTVVMNIAGALQTLK
jgi:hypothetical protein